VPRRRRRPIASETGRPENLPRLDRGRTVPLGTAGDGGIRGRFHALDDDGGSDDARRDRRRHGLPAPRRDTPVGDGEDRRCGPAVRVRQIPLLGSRTEEIGRERMDGEDRCEFPQPSVRGGADMAIQPVAGIREERRSGARTGVEDEVPAAGDAHARIAVHGALELHGERGRDRGEGGEWSRFSSRSSLSPLYRAWVGGDNMAFSILSSLHPQRHSPCLLSFALSGETNERRECRVRRARS